MNIKRFKRIISIILCISTLISTQFVYGADGTGGSILNTFEDTNKFKALTFTVDPVSSTSSIQAFAVGWNVKVLDASGKAFAEVYLATPPQFDDTKKIYYLPLSKGFTHASLSNETVSVSIESMLSSDKVTGYKSIVTRAVGSTFLVDAHIQKYTYDPSRTPKYLPVSPTVTADNMTEINTSFSEFSTAFKSNLPGNYFDLSKTFTAPEPVLLPTPKVNLTMPIDGSTVLQGTTVTFKGFGTGVHHIGGFVDGKMYGVEQLNPNEDINTQMKYETAVKLDVLGPHTFYIVGRNTALQTETGSATDKSATHTVTVVAPAPNTGNIYVTNLDYSTNSIISSSSIPNVAYGAAKTVSSPSLDGYDCQGSYQTFATATPDKSKMAAATSQTVTLTSTNKDVYVYFWYKAKPVVVVPDCQVTATLYDTTVRAGEYFNVFGNANDTKGHTITGYYWNAYGADEKEANGNMVKLLYMTPGIYDISLNVVCAANNVALGTAKITVTEPIPRPNINITGNTKENRKITIDGSASSAPEKFPMDWTKTTWKLEPVTSSNAKWEFGLKLQDGTIKIINQSIDQAFLKGQTKFDFQTRYAGQYSVTLTVTNSKNLTATTTNIITVTPDLAPIANFNGDTYVLRNQSNPLGSTYPTFGKATINDKSTSPDGDTIIKRIWGYRYNSNNNYDSTGIPNFLDETTIYKSNNTDAFIVGQRLVVDSENDLNMEIWSYDVGKYAYELTVVEDIPDSETIRELLLDSDYKRGYRKEW